MRVRHIVWMLLAVACSTRSAPRGIVCQSSEALFPDTSLQRMEGWYGPQWRALEAGPLCGMPASVSEVFRFVWLPSFHPAVAVTVSWTQFGSTLVAKRLNGAGGYAPGGIARDTTVELSSTQEEMLQDLVMAAGFFTEPTKEPPTGGMGVDGAQWILEWASAGRYHAVDRWSPRRDGPYKNFRALGEWFLKLSGLVPDSLVAEY